MKDKMGNKYVQIGLTLFCVLSALMLLFFAFYRWNYIAGFIKTIVGILMPFIYGLAIAYLMNPILIFFENIYHKVFKKFSKKKKKDLNKTCRVLSLCTSTIIFVGILFTCFYFLIPEILRSLQMLISNTPLYLENIKGVLIDFFGSNAESKEFINDIFSNMTTYLNTWLETDIISSMLTILGNSIFSTLKFLYNIVIGFIISIYVLYDKDKFKAQIKKLLYTFFPDEKINIILDNIRYTDRVFGSFFSGKLLDSLIIGIICFISLLILNMPYALIVSVIVGVTNFIPYFGPFIGAIPSAFLIMLVSPSKSLVFLVYIFILQQVDGNIIGPKILGSKTGLSSFWVLFSLLIFGGLFGLVGMILGVPIFSIFYSFINGLIKRRLSDKGLPTDSKDYLKLNHIDSKTHKLVYDK